MGSMYRDSYSETGWTRFLKFISGSIPLGRFFRVEVRLLWVTLVIMPLIFLKSAEGLPFLEGVTYIALLMGLIFFIIWTHEMSHIVAGWRFGIETPLITLSPLGGLAHMSSAAPSPRAEGIIAAAGPAVHLLWLALLWPLSWMLDYGDLKPTGWVLDPLWTLVNVGVQLNLWLMVFNLLPCFPMDGGRILRSLLAGRMHPNRATIITTRVGKWAAFAFIAVGIVLWIVERDSLWGLILIAIGISNYGACRRELMAAEYSAGPYMGSGPLQPWQADPDAWKGTGGSARSTPAKSARREKREAHKQQQQAEADEALDGEVDRVLARVSEVGMAGLTAKERKILLRASKRNQGG